VNIIEVDRSGGHPAEDAWLIGYAIEENSHLDALLFHAGDGRLQILESHFEPKVLGHDPIFGIDGSPRRFFPKAQHRAALASDPVKRGSTLGFLQTEFKAENLSVEPHRSLQVRYVEMGFEESTEQSCR